MTMMVSNWLSSISVYPSKTLPCSLVVVILVCLLIGIKWFVNWNEELNNGCLAGLLTHFLIDNIDNQKKKICQRSIN